MARRRSSLSTDLGGGVPGAVRMSPRIFCFGFLFIAFHFACPEEKLFGRAYEAWMQTESGPSGGIPLNANPCRFRGLWNHER